MDSIFDEVFIVKQPRIVVACVLAGLLALNSVGAANPEPVTVEVEFVDPITIAENNALCWDFVARATPAREGLRRGGLKFNSGNARGRIPRS